MAAAKIVSVDFNKTRDLALASMARDDPPARSTATRRAPCSTAAEMRGNVGSEFET